MFVREAPNDRRVCTALRSDAPRRTPESEAIRRSAALSARRQSRIKVEQAKVGAVRWQEGKQTATKGKTRRTAKPNQTKKNKKKKPTALRRAAKDSIHSSNDAKNSNSNSNWRLKWIEAVDTQRSKSSIEVLFERAFRPCTAARKRRASRQPTRLRFCTEPLDKTRRSAARSTR